MTSFLVLDNGIFAWSTYRTGGVSLPLAVNSDFDSVRRSKVCEEVARRIELLILKKLQTGDKFPSKRELAVKTDIWPLYEIESGKLAPHGRSGEIVCGRFRRLPEPDYLLKQGRLAYFMDEDIEYFQGKVDEMRDKWLVPGVIPLQKEVEAE